MFSIEDLAGFPEDTDTPEKKMLRSQLVSTESMNYFDRLPDQLRNFINYAEISYSPKKAWDFYVRNKDITQTINLLKEDRLWFMTY